MSKRLVIGDSMRYVHPDGRVTRGTITGFRYPAGVMKTATGKFGLIKYRIKPNDGRRSFWTVNFANHDKPLHCETDDCRKDFLCSVGTPPRRVCAEHYTDYLRAAATIGR